MHKTSVEEIVTNTVVSKTTLLLYLSLRLVRNRSEFCRKIPDKRE